MKILKHTISRDGGSITVETNEGTFVVNRSMSDREKNGEILREDGKDVTIQEIVDLHYALDKDVQFSSYSWLIRKFYGQRTPKLVFDVDFL